MRAPLGSPMSSEGLFKSSSQNNCVLEEPKGSLSHRHHVQLLHECQTASGHHKKGYSKLRSDVGVQPTKCHRCHLKIFTRKSARLICSYLKAEAH